MFNVQCSKDKALALLAKFVVSKRTYFIIHNSKFIIMITDIVQRLNTNHKVQSSMFKG